MVDVICIYDRSYELADTTEYDKDGRPVATFRGARLAWLFREPAAG